MSKETIYHAIRKLIERQLVISDGGKFTRAESNAHVAPTP
jgi:predicted transcriptional regulator